MRSGDSMDYETLNTEFETKKSIKFKLYSMEYVVEQKEKYVEIYAIYYENRKSKYNSFKELFEKYTVYDKPKKIMYYISITRWNNILLL